MKKIELSAGYHTVVDDEDYEWLSQYKWSAKIYEAGENTRVYAVRSIGAGKYKRKHIKMHREIYEKHNGRVPTGRDIDHVESGHQHGLLNTVGNLRVVSRAQNIANSRKQRNCSSRFKGVYAYRLGDWPRFQAYIRVDGRQRSLGVFDHEEDAARAYDAAALSAWGDCARVNFPTERAA